MNVFHGKVVGIKDGQFGPWTPGVAVGGVVRTGDKFVTGEAAIVATKPIMRTAITTGAFVRQLPYRLPSPTPTATSI